MTDLYSTSPALNSSASALGGLQRPSLSSQTTLSSSGSQIPWRRSNVRHTSNELYVDIVETLSVTYAPSGRPLAAFANGSIAFTCKVSGLPDLLLSLTTGSTTGGGLSSDRGDKVKRTMQRPVFHPCVRLSRWKERGELSFVPPDGRFVLAGYETDLLDSTASPLAATARDLNLPATVTLKTGLGSAGTEFEARLSVNSRYASSGAGTGPAASSLSSNIGRGSSGPSSSDPKTPLIEDLAVSIPIPAAVRNITDLRPSRGEAHWSPGDTAVEWTIPAKEAVLIGSGGAVLRCVVVGPMDGDGQDQDVGSGVGLGAANGGGGGAIADTYDLSLIHI